MPTETETAMTIKHSLTGLLLTVTLAFASGPVAAAQPLIVYTDQSKIIEVSRSPGVVVVGNPSIADASIQGNKVFLHGRGYGTTNVIILDEQGAQLADFLIDVQLGAPNTVSLFKAGALQSYTCVEDCESIMHVGDNPVYFKDVVLDRNKDKINLATGQKSAEANQPPPAQ